MSASVISTASSSNTESVMEIDLESLSSKSGVASTSSGYSYSSHASRHTLKQQQAFDDETLATKESKDLIKLRFFLITILFWVTVGCGLTIWVYFTENQEEEFEHGYIETSNKVLDTLAESFHISLSSIDSFVLAIVLQFNSWPFVTVPNFSIRAEKLRKISNAAAITKYHYVSDEMKEEWDVYTKAINNNNSNSDKAENEMEFEEHDLHLNFTAAESEGFFMPIWEQSPVGRPAADSTEISNKALLDAWKTFQNEEGVALSYVRNIPTSEDPNLDVEGNNEYMRLLLGDNNDNETSQYYKEPFGDIFYPIINNYNDGTIDIAEDDGGNYSLSSSSKNGLAGVLSVSFYWKDILRNILAGEQDGLHVVVSNSCNQSFTYTWNNSEPVYLGSGDLHEPKFNKFKQSLNLSDIGESETYTGLPLSSGGCQYIIHTYPSSEMLECYYLEEASPSTFTALAVVIFIFTSMVFVFYDCLVERRQRKVYSSAVKNNAIVSSLFPKTVRDRLYRSNAASKDVIGSNGGGANSNRSAPAKTRMKSFVNEDSKNDNDNINVVDAPIADLFLNCTVLFADISGFTSWSSERSPSQVFVLLETIYGAFDKIADRRGVFKVETIGDCYMAVTGLPNPKKDHALIMARFARDCRDQMNQLTKSLEVTLGPETSDLSMRFGLHSGPVTAGVLRGQKSRFQLFGDTVNTAARMESTGVRNRVHISEETAKLIKDAGKIHWLTPREEMVEAKGKGKLSTYWVFEKKDRRMSTASTVSTSTTSDNSSQSSESSLRIENVKNFSYDRRRRLIDWNVDLFSGSIRKIVARRIGSCNNRSITNKKGNGKVNSNRRASASSATTTTANDNNDNKTVLDEVVEIIELPSYDAKASFSQEDPQAICLDDDVMLQLKKYIFTISAKYNENAFHNFEHASHVTMSVAKLLSRIVAPDMESTSSSRELSIDEFNVSSTLHDHTYGITSDPLTQFACIFSALIHDVDHQGVPNTILVEEETAVAKKYSGRSVAEQNSVDIAWSLFLEPQFEALRNVVCPTAKELDRLRQLIVNMVMATDIMDKDLKQLRNKRWEKAFKPPIPINDNSIIECESYQDQINRKATIVLEHLIQASDVCHTMQHWHVYRKWNERLFEEMYHAYRTGRAKADPRIFWYKGELGFFDHYIIPLSKKLSDCGVFGVSSDEYLNYAVRNRSEWEQRGESMVADMIKKYDDKIKQ